MLSEMLSSKPSPMALGGGGDVGSRCIYVDFNLGEKIWWEIKRNSC